MTIRRFFDQDIVVRRLKETTGRKKAFQATATVEGHVQELDQRARQTLGIIHEQAWEAWFPEEVEVQKGDKLTDENGVIYVVREKVVKAYGINRHTDCVLVEFNE